MPTVKTARTVSGAGSARNDINSLPLVRHVLVMELRPTWTEFRVGLRRRRRRCLSASSQLQLQNWSRPTIQSTRNDAHRSTTHNQAWTHREGCYCCRQPGEFDVPMISAYARRLRAGPAHTFPEEYTLRHESPLLALPDRRTGEARASPVHSRVADPPNHAGSKMFQTSTIPGPTESPYPEPRSFQHCPTPFLWSNPETNSPRHSATPRTQKRPLLDEYRPSVAVSHWKRPRLTSKPEHGSQRPQAVDDFQRALGLAPDDISGGVALSLNTTSRSPDQSVSPTYSACSSGNELSVDPTNPAKPFRLLNLPVELVLQILSHMEFTEQVMKFLRSCRPLCEILAVPRLQEEKVLRLAPDSVHISLHGTSLLAATLLCCLPVFDKALFVDVGLEAVVTCQKQLKRFFKKQRPCTLRVEFPTHSTHRIELGAAIPALFAMLHSLKGGLGSLCFDTVRSVHSPPVQPFPSVPPAANSDQFLGVWKFCRALRSLRELSISAEWTFFPHFHSLWTALAEAPRLLTFTASNITSEDQCRRLLSPLRSRVLRNLFLLTKLNAAIDVRSTSLIRHKKLEQLSVISIPDPFYPAASSVPMTLPAVPEIRLTCNFPSLSAVNPSSLARLTLVPVTRYGDPLSAAYCKSLELLLQGIRSLSRLSLHGVDLRLEFPRGVSDHLSGHVSGCNCAQLSQGFIIAGIRTLRIASGEYSPLCLVYLLQFQDKFVDVQELHCDVRADKFKKLGGVSALSTMRPRSSDLRAFYLLDQAWKYDGSLWALDCTFVPQ
ncbi:hypothetical protein NMY22_g2558 [Coprinellus aureogranulatus]|nr:hypothetical protein NMY22_g2558 [Coprinellus aureogranulatus]